MGWYLGNIFKDVNTGSTEEGLKTFHAFFIVFRLREDCDDIIYDYVNYMADRGMAAVRMEAEDLKFDDESDGTKKLYSL